MSTHSTLQFIDKTRGCESVELALYQQMDGYPEGVGRQIYEFLKDIKITNGFAFGAEMGKVANGMDDLALQYVAKYKTEVGNLYTLGQHGLGQIEEYNYKVIYEILPDGTYQLRVVANYEGGAKYVGGQDLFEGTVQEFGEWLDSRGRE